MFPDQFQVKEVIKEDYETVLREHYGARLPNVFPYDLSLHGCLIRENGGLLSLLEGG